MNLKILHFAFCFFPVYGGMTTRLYNILSDNRNDHILYVPQAPNSYIPSEFNCLLPQERFSNILVKRIQLPERGSRKFPVLDYVGDMLFHEEFARSFIDQACHEKVDIIYGHTPLAFGYAAMKLARKMGFPFIHEAHALIHDIMDRSMSVGIKSMYQNIFRSVILTREAAILKYADSIIVQTPRVSERIQEIYKISKDKISVIANGVDVEHFNPDRYRPEGEKLRCEMNWGNKRVFLYSGLFDQINGIDIYIEALRNLPKDIQDNIVAVFLGRGPLEHLVENTASALPYVQYLGKISYEEMPKFYSAADVFIIPRPSCKPAETLMPMKLYEAMAMKKVILVSNVFPMAEALVHGELGYIYEKDNIKDLISNLCRLATTTLQNTTMQEHAREKVVNEHSWLRAHDQLENIYKYILGK